MLFNSFEYLLFLPVVFLLYWFVFDYALRKCKHQLLWQNLLIVVASYIFYGWWDWRFLILIAITTILSFLSGIGIEKAPTQRGKKAVMIANVVVNLGILGLYKYYDFFTIQFAQLFGIESDFLLLHLILPVGISFYTFQALSYSIDVYRKQIESTHDVIAFTAFLSFFPQLVAGPIERATNLLPQFQKKRTFDYAQAVDGMRQILWGLFKKIVVADN
jgi:D-alanyl-lipoteichoic acid acyltransferase DltB (MBOAT superfamily)